MNIKIQIHLLTSFNFTISSPSGQYGTSPTKHFCLLKNKSNKSGSASVADIFAYILKFDYITNTFSRLRKLRKKPSENTYNVSYQNYLEIDNNNVNENDQSTSTVNNNNEEERITSGRKVEQFNEDDQYFKFLETVIFGSPTSMEPVHLNHLFVKKNNKGLVPKFAPCGERRPSEEILKHNLDKVQFYENSPQCASLEDVFVSTYNFYNFCFYLNLPRYGIQHTPIP